MTFLNYLAASTDRNAQRLAEDLSGLADGANDLAEVVACLLRRTLGDPEAVLAVEEAEYRWDRCVEESPLRDVRPLAVRVPKLPRRGRMHLEDLENGLAGFGD